MPCSKQGLWTKGICYVSRIHNVFGTAQCFLLRVCMIMQWLHKELEFSTTFRAWIFQMWHAYIGKNVGHGQADTVLLDLCAPWLFGTHPICGMNASSCSLLQSEWMMEWRSEWWSEWPSITSMTKKNFCTHCIILNIQEDIWGSHFCLTFYIDFSITQVRV